MLIRQFAVFFVSVLVISKMSARARDKFYCVFATTTILTLCSANALDKPVLVLACVSNVIVCSIIVKNSGCRSVVVMVDTAFDVES